MYDIYYTHIDLSGNSSQETLVGSIATGGTVPQYIGKTNDFGLILASSFATTPSLKMIPYSSGDTVYSNTFGGSASSLEKARIVGDYAGNVAIQYLLDTATDGCAVIRYNVITGVTDNAYISSGGICWGITMPEKRGTIYQYSGPEPANTTTAHFPSFGCI